MNRYTFSSTVAKLVIAALREGQMHKRMLCGAINNDYNVIDHTVTRLVELGDVVVLGTAKEAGYTDIRKDAPVYGLPGTQLHVLTRKAGAKCGSGQKAEPNRGFEFRPLARDFFGHWQLAMTTRR